MLIIGCDYHPSMQQIAWVDTGTGEYGERRLTHCEEAEQFYREWKEKGVSVRVGMEATGHSRWFQRLLGELNHELWVGDPAEIRAKRVRKQRNDRRDAQHILKLLLEDTFPRIWVPTPQNRDVRQLVMHRHRLVGMRTRVMNQLHAIAMNEGVRRKRGLWTEKGRAQLESLRLPPLDHSAAARAAGAAGPLRSQHRPADPGDRARSRTVARCATVANPSWSGADHCAGFRLGPGHSRSVSLR
jgi:transposase